MKVGVVLPVEGGVATRDLLLATARAAEQLGFDSVWATDRVLYPAAPPSGYPYAQERAAVAFDPDRQWLEPLTTLSMVAGVTERVRLGTNVLVLPYRQPVVLAQELATLDWLSAGRVVLGVGIGWMTEEFEALGIPRQERGSRTDEYMSLMRALWSRSGPVSFQGRFVSIEGMSLAASASGGAGPPIYVGGNSDAALKRVARLGDGWLGVDLKPSEAGETIQRLHEFCQDLGRDPSALELSIRRRLEPAPASAKLQPPLGIGTAELVDQIGHYREVGIGLMVFDLLMLPDMLDGLHRLADEVMAQL